MQNSRRIFLAAAAGAASTAMSSRLAWAQDAPKLSETDPQAVSLGYRDDATKADKARFPKYEPGQTCSTCQLYMGKPTDAAAPCPIFGNKQVAANGWCSVWVRKA